MSPFIATQVNLTIKSTNASTLLPFFYLQYKFVLDNKTICFLITEKLWCNIPV